MASVQCPTCFTRSPAPDDGSAVVCPGCDHEFTPDRLIPSARPAKKSAPRSRRHDDDDQPRRRSRRENDRPARKGLPLPQLLGVVGAIVGLMALAICGGTLPDYLASNKSSAPGNGPAVAAPPVNPPVATQAPPVAPAAGPGDFRDRPGLDGFGGPAVAPGAGAGAGGLRAPPPAAPGVGGPQLPPGTPGGPVVPGGPGGVGGQPPAVAPPVAPTKPKALDLPEGDPNSNALVVKHRAKLELKASSDWKTSWPVGHLFDGVATTSWYSNAPDNTAAGQNPVVSVVFPEDVSVKRVSILGNRDPDYPTGYTVSEGTVDLLDADNKVISTHPLKGSGKKSDFDLKLDKPQTVRGVRFTMTKSERGSCALSEVMIE